MEKRTFASISATLVAILCVGAFVILINANHAAAPAAILEEPRLEMDTATTRSATPKATPHTSYNTPSLRYNMRDIQYMYLYADYYTTIDGVDIHVSQRNMAVRYVDILFSHYAVEYIPGVANLWYRASVEVTFADNIRQGFGNSESVRWSSSNEHVLNVGQGGNILAVGVGSARIIAEYGGVIGEKEVTVVQGAIERIAFWPEEVVIIQGITDDGRYISYMPQVSIVAYTSHGNSFRLPHDSNVLTVRSENPDIVAVEALMPETFALEGGNIAVYDSIASGRAARMAGETYLEISIADISGQARAGELSTRIPVVALCTSDMHSIDLWHYGDTLSLGMSSGFATHAVFNCGRRVDLFHYAEWAVDAPEILAINSFGMITALSLGEATVTVSYAGLSNSITLRVVEAVNYADRIPFP